MNRPKSNAKKKKPSVKLKVFPLTPGRWADLEELFGKRGACGGCWCMYWRITRARFEKQKGSGNKAALKKIVKSKVEPGLIAYLDGEPVGWCALEPRESYSVLERSRILKPVDDRPVWSVVCFFISKSHRRRGLSVELLRAATRYAKKRGAKIVEGYPLEPKKKPMPDAFAWTGLSNAFQKAGFTEVARRSPTRPIMRWSSERG